MPLANSKSDSKKREAFRDPTGRNRKVFIFDPLGPNNSRVDHRGRPVMLQLKIDLQRAMPGSGPVKFKMYPYATQMKDSTYCGWFALYVADLLQRYMKRHPNAGARELSGIIEQKFGRSADPGDERKLVEHFRV